MTDRLALLRAILADPRDNTPRLVYADWLDEHGAGDADRARAELIRLWFRLRPNLRSTTRALGDWLTANAARLWPAVGRAAEAARFKARGRCLTVGWERVEAKAYFDRGFAETVQVPRNPWYARLGPALAADEPLAAVEPLTGVEVTPDGAAAVRAADWGPAVLARLTDHDAAPDPETKVYRVRLAAGAAGRVLAYPSERVRQALRAALTAAARETTGLAAPERPA